MADMRESCAAAIKALKQDDTLTPCFSEDKASDILWTLLSVSNWEHGTRVCGWPQEKYIKMITLMTQQLFYAGEKGAR